MPPDEEKAVRPPSPTSERPADGHEERPDDAEADPPQAPGTHGYSRRDPFVIDTRPNADTVRPEIRLAAALVLLLPALVALSPAAAAVGLGATALAALGVGARRSRVDLGEGGIAVRSLYGLRRRWLPLSAVTSLNLDGRELVGRDEQGKVLFRLAASARDPWAEALATLHGARDALDLTPTGFERTGPGLEAWLAAVDARVKDPAGPAYRDQPFSWEHALDVFRSKHRGAEARAGAAWALLGSDDPAHRRAVLDAASSSLPPLVLAVCALHPAGSATYLPLAKKTLAFLDRADRRQWKRLRARQRTP